MQKLQFLAIADNRRLVHPRHKFAKIFQNVFFLAADPETDQQLGIGEHDLRLQCDRIVLQHHRIVQHRGIDIRLNQLVALRKHLLDIVGGVLPVIKRKMVNRPFFQKHQNRADVGAGFFIVDTVRTFAGKMKQLAGHGMQRQLNMLQIRINDRFDLDQLQRFIFDGRQRLDDRAFLMITPCQIPRPLIKIGTQIRFVQNHWHRFLLSDCSIRKSPATGFYSDFSSRAINSLIAWDGFSPSYSTR